MATAGVETVVVLHTLMSFLLRQDTPTGPPPTPPPPVCYGIYGCFPIDGPWQSIERPISVPPLPPERITPIFCLHTPRQPRCKELRLDNLSTLHNTTYLPMSPLVLITHGYLESTQLEWVVRMVDAVVDSGKAVLSVDWSVAAPPPYAQAVANVRLIAAITGRLLHIMVDESGLRLSDIHMVGHSLGAQLVAYIGEFISETYGEKVGRITGLDPAGPYFINTPPEVRLDPSDATFVDVIHTDIPEELWQLDKLGYPEPMGHLDFYPNGGSYQAGCQGSAMVHITKQSSFAGGVVSYLGCNHQRAYHYLINSLQCPFLGVVCESWEAYRDGKCWGCNGDRCGTMGFPARPLHLTNISSINSGNDVRIPHSTEGRMGIWRNEESDEGGKDIEESTEVIDEVLPIKVFFGTSSEAPFCAEQYAVTVWTSSSPASIRGGGDLALFTVTLKGPSATYTIPPLEKSAFIEAGESKRWLGWSALPLSDLHSLQVDYQEDKGILNSLIWRFSPPSLYIDAFTIEALSTGHTQTFPFCGEKMQAGQSYTLFPNTQCELT